MSAISEGWKQVAVQISDQVYQMVNTAEMVGTEDETGCILMFFNASNHGGKSTLVSSMADPEQVKKLLKGALRQLHRREIIERSGRAN